MTDLSCEEMNQTAGMSLGNFAAGEGILLGAAIAVNPEAWPVVAAVSVVDAGIAFGWW